MIDARGKKILKKIKKEDASNDRLKNVYNFMASNCTMTDNDNVDLRDAKSYSMSFYFLSIIFLQFDS